MIYHIKEIDMYVDLKQLFAVTGIGHVMPRAPIDNGVRQFSINVAGHVHEVRCNSLLDTADARADLIIAWQRMQSQ